MEQKRFNIDPQHLQKALFQVYAARQGAQTTLNVNFLPDLLQHIKSFLTNEQRIKLEDYHLQNYIMELSLNYNGQKNIKSLRQLILKNIRQSNNFWYRHNNKSMLDQQQLQKHKAIQSYLKDIDELKELFGKQNYELKEFTPNYEQKTLKNYYLKSSHTGKQPQLNTRHSLNHLCFIPKFILQDINEKKQQKQQLIKQCIIFFLSNKKSIFKQKTLIDSSSKSNNQESQKIDQSNNHQISQKILDKYLQYLEVQSKSVRMQNNRQMYNFTCNLLKICQEIIKKQIIIPKQMPINQNKLIIRPTCSNSFQQILSKTTEDYLNQNQINTISQQFVTIWQNYLYFFIKQMQKQNNQNQYYGWLIPTQEILSIKQQYQNLLNKPDFVQLTKYRATGNGIPWKQQQYLTFLKGLYDFFNIPTNNKKIASFMGSQIQPNHVKHVKNIYFSVMKDRIQRGEFGGGKRGKCSSKLQFLQRDINNFSMKWFQKSKKKLKRKSKKKSKDSESQQQIIDQNQSQMIQ